jgi:hypothetical protein
MPSFHKMYDFFMIRHTSLRQSRQQTENLLPIPQRPAGQLADNERMTEDLLVIEQRLKALAPLSELLDPHRSVHESHAGLARRRLGIGRSCFSVPARLAKRRALSLETKASSPRRTREVFSSTPVSVAARRKRASSMLSVVLMHISMHYQSI